MRRTAALLLTLASLPALAQNKPWIDAESGVALLPPENWECIPTPKEMKYDWKPDEKVKMLAKWNSKQGDADNRAVGAEFHSIKGATDVAGAEDIYTADRKQYGLMFEVTSSKEFIASGRFKAKYVIAKLDRGYGRLVAFYADGEKAFALDFFMSYARLEKKVPDWMKHLQSFQFLSAKDIERLKKAPPTLLPGWQTHKTKNYDIQFNCDKPFAITVGTHLEAILLEYMKFFPLDSFGGGPTTVEGKEDQPAAQKTTLDRMTVKLFKDNETFGAYAAANGVGGAAAYFSPGQNELCGYKTVSEGKKLSIHIMYHEAMHQYLHALFGENVRIPIWLNEGMAEYFFGGEFQDVSGRFVIGINKQRIDTIRQAARDGSFVPLAKLFKYTQAEYYRNAGLCYAQGWSVAYFMWTTPDAKYKGVILEFMKKLRQTEDPDAAFEATFGQLDPEQLEKDWKEYVISKM